MTSYGAFIDLGGVDGVVQTSELSWKRIKSPAEVLSVDDVVTVFVKSFDKEKNRISFGYKTEETNPWFIFTKRLPLQRQQCPRRWLRKLPRRLLNKNKRSAL